MRKWNLLTVAMLLAIGSVSVTSCINNDEPAGIVNLRGAKAEWLLVKADFERVQVEIQKIELEKQKLDLALKQIEVDSATHIGQLEMELRVKKYEKATLELQEQIAKAEENYQRALAQLEVAKITVKDSAFAKAIEDVSIKLSTVRSNIADSTAKLLDKKVDFAKATAATGTAMENILLAKVEQEQVNVNSAKEQLALLTDLQNVPVTEWKTKIQELASEISQLQLSRAEDSIAYKEKEKAIDVFKAENITPLKNQLSARTQYTLTIPATIQNDVYNEVLNNNAFALTQNNNKSNAVQDADGNYYLQGDFVAYDEYEKLATNLENGTGINGLKYLLNESFKTHFATAYNEATGLTFSNSEVTSEDIALVEQKLSGLTEDLTKAEAAYNKVLATWEAAVPAYEEKIKAYGNEIDNLYQQAANEIKRFKAGSKDTATLNTKLTTYCDIREALDSATVCTAIRTALKKNLDLATWANTAASNIETALGKDLANVANLQALTSSTAKKGSLVYNWIMASKAVWGTAETAKAARLTPLAEKDATADKTGTPFEVYLYYKEVVNDVTNAQAWKDLIETVETTIKEMKANILDINTQIAAKETEIADQQEALNTLEIEMTLKTTQMSAKEAVKKEIEKIQINGHSIKDLESTIATTKETVANAEKTLATVQAILDIYQDGIKYDNMHSQDLAKGEYLDVIAKEIENFEGRIAELQKEFDLLTKTKDNLLEAALAN